MIYVIRAGHTDMVKIGKAVDVDMRRRELQAGNWHRLSVIRLLDAPDVVERWLHRHFASRRVSGEWFRFEEAMLTIEPPRDVMSPASPRPTGELTPAHIEERARAAGLPMKKVCAMAGIAVSTFTRWKSGTTDLNIAAYQRLLTATEPSVEAA